MPCIDPSYTPVYPIARDFKEDYPNRFFQRCIAAGSRIAGTHCEPGSSVVAVSHAATVISVVATILGVSVAEVPPAGPGSIYQLRRKAGSTKWEGELFGAVAHLTEAGGGTVPWGYKAKPEWGESNGDDPMHCDIFEALLVESRSKM